MKEPAPNLRLAESGAGSDPCGSDFWPTPRAGYSLFAGAVYSPSGWALPVVFEDSGASWGKEHCGLKPNTPEFHP